MIERVDFAGNFLELSESACEVSHICGKDSLLRLISVGILEDCMEENKRTTEADDGVLKFELMDIVG